MKRRIKNYLSNVLKKINLILFSLLVFFGLFIVSKPAYAVFGIGDIGLLDMAQMELDALDFIDNVVLRIFIFILVLLVESQAFLWLSATLLEWAIGLPINLGIGDPTKNLLVSTGWKFTLGLSDMFFILIFIAIALAHILKIETFQMKKALPKLIIIALLVNFSLLLVGVFVDIAQIFQKSIRDAFGANFVTLATEPLIKSYKNLISGWFVPIIIGYLASALIPYVNVAALVTMGGIFLSEFLFGTMTTSIFLIILGFVLGSIFFLYFVLFIMRIAMIWILAVLAPLAFLCYILPQTKKWWDEWLKYLIEWSTLGILVLFLVGLGLKLFGLTGAQAILPWLQPSQGLPAFASNYLFLLVYMGIVFFYATTKLTPIISDVLINYGKGLGRGATRLAKAKSLQRDLWGPAAETIAKSLGRLGGGLRERAEKGLEKAGTGGRLFWGAIRTVGKGVERPVSPLIEYAAKQRRVTLPAGWKQMSDRDKVDYVEALSREEDKLVLQSAMKEEGSLQRIPALGPKGEKFRNEAIERAKKFSEDPRLKELYKKEINDIFDAFPDKADLKTELNLEVTKEDKDKLEKEVRKIAEEIEATAKIDVKINEFIEKTATEEKISREEAVQNLATGVRRMRRMKPASLVEVSKGSLTSLTGRIALAGMTDRQVQRIYDSFGKDVMDKLMEDFGGINAIFKEKTPEQAAKLVEKIYNENPRLFRFFAQTPAGRAMNWAGLKYMSDPYDQPTTRFDLFERKMRILETIKEEKELEEMYTRTKLQRELERKIEETKRKIKEEKRRGIDVGKMEEEVKKIEEELEKKRKENERFRIANIESVPERKRKWEEIERLMKPPKR
jgi:hypothetical protein